MWPEGDEVVVSVVSGSLVVVVICDWVVAVVVVVGVGVVVWVFVVLVLFMEMINFLGLEFLLFVMVLGDVM